MIRIRRSLARLTGPRASQPTGRAAHRPGRAGHDGFAGRFIQDMATVANVAVGHQLGQRGRGARHEGQAYPGAAAAMPWPDTVPAPGLRPHTVQLCIHCRQRPAGFWVSRRGGQIVRRPWCLSCCQELDRDRYNVVPFDS
jgi:hypothetical protein